ncbi:HPr family phosphocarrier protein [Mycoplasmopsis opalescens]|uniref:HPr family phosphocarrier protein n=1 Tax=Mycoplasmopsis opalescens TaxID=114886 RepID=UPI00068A2605|nr:HPr family phosphocarrier protein [Mycoplasmopsis opalescens]
MTKIVNKIIKSQIGIDALLASQLTSLSSQFASDIIISLPKLGKSGDLKSLINLMSLNIRLHDEIEIKFVGSDAEKAANLIVEFLENEKIC